MSTPPPPPPPPPPLRRQDIIPGERNREERKLDEDYIELNELRELLKEIKANRAERRSLGDLAENLPESEDWRVEENPIPKPQPPGLTEKIDDLHEKLRDLDRRIERMTARRSAMKDELVSLRRQKREMPPRITRRFLKERFDAAYDAKEEELQRRITSVKARIETREDTIADLTEEYERLTSPPEER